MKKLSYVLLVFGSLSVLGLQAFGNEASQTLIEFRQGDRLPVNFKAEGDFFESIDSDVPAYWLVKRTFWLRIQGEDIQVSLDGTHFKRIQDSVSGTLTAGASTSEAGGSGTANAIAIALKASIK